MLIIIMYRLIIYGDPTKNNIILQRDFRRIKDIIEYSNGKITYDDTKTMTRTRKRKNITYKSFLSVVRI